jgi:hypothetical protein
MNLNNDSNVKWDMSAGVQVPVVGRGGLRGYKIIFLLIHLYKSGQADKMAKIADLNLLVFDGEHRCQHGCNVDLLRFFSIVFAVNISFNNG